MTRLEIRIQGVHLGYAFKGVRTTPYKETAMVLLACIVVACSARLEVLDLHLGWYNEEACVLSLLARPLRLAPLQSQLSFLAS